MLYKYFMIKNISILLNNVNYIIIVLMQKTIYIPFFFIVYSYYINLVLKNIHTQIYIEKNVIFTKLHIFFNYIMNEKKL